MEQENGQALDTAPLTPIEQPEHAATPDLQEGEQQPEPVKPDPVQKRIDRVIAEKRAAEQRAALAEAQAQELIKRYNVPNQQAEPLIEEFDSLQDWLKARDNWVVNQAQTQQQQNLQQQQQQAQAAKETEVLKAELTKAEAVIPGVMQRIERGIALSGGRVSPAVDDAVGLLDNKIFVLHELIGTPDKAADFWDKTPKEQLRLLIETDAQLTANQPTRRPAAANSNAPEPITPVSSSKPASRNPEQMSTAEWMKWRQAQIKR